MQAWLLFLEGEPKQAVQLVLKAQTLQETADVSLWSSSINAVVSFLLDAGRTPDALTVLHQAISCAPPTTLPPHSPSPLFLITLSPLSLPTLPHHSFTLPHHSSSPLFLTTLSHRFLSDVFPSPF